MAQSIIILKTISFNFLARVFKFGPMIALSLSIKTRASVILVTQLNAIFVYKIIDFDLRSSYLTQRCVNFKLSIKL